MNNNNQELEEGNSKLSREEPMKEFLKNRTGWNPCEQENRKQERAR